ncbi:IS30 family transposase [Lacticaseibacillus paracasei subsp. paracasei Lpp227]|nr:IS30 family transposase [Lacticaseibacillus paracasei subsp. paracasei Lpp227]
MSPYTHLTLKDRESILLGISTGKTLDTIAKEIGRSKSTVSREIARNGGWRSYSAATAQDRYRRVRLASRRPRILDHRGLVTLSFDISRCYIGRLSRLPVACH